MRPHRSTTAGFLYHCPITRTAEFVALHNELSLVERMQLGPELLQGLPEGTSPPMLRATAQAKRGFEHHGYDLAHGMHMTPSKSAVGGWISDLVEAFPAGSATPQSLLRHAARHTKSVEQIGLKQRHNEVHATLSCQGGQAAALVFVKPHDLLTCADGCQGSCDGHFLERHMEEVAELALEHNRNSAFTAATLDVPDCDAGIPLFAARRAVAHNLMGATGLEHRLKPAHMATNAWQGYIIKRIRNATPATGKAALAVGNFVNYNYEESHW